MRATIVFSVLAAVLAAIGGEQHVLRAGAAADAVKCDVCKKAVPVVAGGVAPAQVATAACGSYTAGSPSQSTCKIVVANVKSIANAAKTGCWKDEAGKRTLVSPCPDLPAAACGFLSDAAGTFCDPVVSFKKPLTQY